MRGNHRNYAGMELESTLLRCVDAYCEAKRLARPTVSAQILRDSRAFDRVASGGSLTVRNFQRAMKWLSANWPEDAAWPEGVDRPASTEPSAAA